MTPSDAALVARLRARAQDDIEDAESYGPLIVANIAAGDALLADVFADKAAHNANRGLDMESAAAALERLSGRGCETCRWREPNIASVQMDRDNCFLFMLRCHALGFTCGRWSPRPDGDGSPVATGREGRR